MTQEMHVTEEPSDSSEDWNACTHDTVCLGSSLGASGHQDSEEDDWNGDCDVAICTPAVSRVETLGALGCWAVGFTRWGPRVAYIGNMDEAMEPTGPTLTLLSKLIET
jgi:hypothetical protein